FQNTCGLDPQGRNTESGEVLYKMDDAIVLVEVNQIEGEQDTQGMNSTRRYDPHPFIEPQPELSNQPSQTREGSIRQSDAQAKKAFASLVVHAIRLSFHFNLPLLAS